MQLIGLTGGIASGKSTVARRLAEHGAIVIDADQLARDVVEPGTDGLKQVAATFGESVIAADGSLDRKRLGEVVFGNDEARRQLEQILHPAIEAEFTRRFSEISHTHPDSVVVYDVPLLVEAKRDQHFDLILTTHATPQVQLDRLQRERGLDAESALARIAAQATDEQRIARANHVIDTSGSLSDTIAAVDALWLDVISNLD